jgi:hypothetical protein
MQIGEPLRTVIVDPPEASSGRAQPLSNPGQRLGCFGESGEVLGVMVNLS